MDIYVADEAKNRIETDGLILEGQKAYSLDDDLAERLVADPTVNVRERQDEDPEVSEPGELLPEPEADASTDQPPGSSQESNFDPGHIQPDEGETDTEEGV